MEGPDVAAPRAATSARDPHGARRSSLLPALAAVVAFGSAWWLATPCEAPPYRIVSFADLDLSRPADFSKLMARLDAAAAAVCAAALAREAASARRRVDCIEQARQRALLQVNAQRAEVLRDKVAPRIAGGAEPARSPGSAPVRVVAPRATPRTPAPAP